MINVVRLDDVAAAAETTVSELLQLVADAPDDSRHTGGDRPVALNGQIFRGDCWCCGHTDVSDFPYDTCTNCKKPGMEWS